MQPRIGKKSSFLQQKFANIIYLPCYNRDNFYVNPLAEFGENCERTYKYRLGVSEQFLFVFFLVNKENFQSLNSGLKFLKIEVS